MNLSREQFGNAVAEATHVKLEGLIDVLRAMGFAVEDVSYHNDTDVSCALYEGPEIVDSGEPIVTVFVVDPESEIHFDNDTPAGSFYSPYINDQWPAGHYVSGVEISKRIGVEYAPSFLTVQELKKWLDKVGVERVLRVAEEIAQGEE